MSAAAKSRLSSLKDIKVLGVIAGAGNLPARLLAACDMAGIEVFVVGFEGQTDRSLMAGRNHLYVRLGAAGQTISTLKAHDIRDLVMIGSIRRPSIAELRPDLRTARFFARLGWRALGDDGLLKAVRKELESDGFILHGIQEFASGLLTPEGAIGRIKPKKSDWRDIERGIEISQAIGRFDVGQSVIVQEGIVLGVEGVEGTDELIRRCSAYRRKGQGGVLVKTCKPGQDRDLDLPAIGPDTVQLCAEAGFGGIVVQAGHSLMLDPQGVAQLADRYKIFVIALDLTRKDHAV